MQAYLDAPKKGLETELEGKKLQEWGKIFLKISEKGLIKRNKLNATDKNETIYLNHIEDILSKNTSRAQLLLNKFKLNNNLDFFDNEKEDFSYTGF